MLRKVVFTKHGEISYTPPSFNCFLEEFTGDLNEQERFLLSSDDWRLTEPMPKHEIREMDIPDWIPADLHREYFRLSNLGQALQSIEYNLTNGKSRFFQSLRDQLRERGYLTKRQIETILYPPWKRHY